MYLGSIKAVSPTWCTRALLCLVLVWLGAGASAAQHRTLMVAAYPAVDEVIKASIPAWKRSHPDVEVRVLSRAFEDHHSIMGTALSTASNLPDVMAVEFGYLGRFAAEGRLEDLTGAPYHIMTLQPRFVPFAFAQATTRSGAVVAAPTDIGPGTLVYRADLLRRAGVTEAELTRSWESFVASGDRIKAATGAFLLPHARNLVDILIRSDVPRGEGLYFDAGGKVLVNSPRFVRAFQLARTVRQHKLDAELASWSPEWSDGLRKGRIASLMSGAWMVAHLSGWIAPESTGLWRCAQLPQDTWGAWGGTFYTIPKRAKNKALAWEFIQFLTLNREVQLSAFKSQNAFPALREVHADPFFEQSIDYLGGQPARLLWREAAKHINAVDVHPQDLAAREVVNNELEKVLLQGKDVHRALSDAAVTIERRIRQ